MVDDDEYHVTEGPFATLQDLLEKSSPALINPARTGYDVALRLPAGATNSPVIERYWHPAMNLWTTTPAELGMTVEITWQGPGGITQNGEFLIVDFPGYIRYEWLWAAGSFPPPAFSPILGYSVGQWTMTIGYVNEGPGEAFLTLYEQMPIYLFSEIVSDFSNYLRFRTAKFYGNTAIYTNVPNKWQAATYSGGQGQPALVREVQP
jgi:hypothetical protein